ncbi:MAG: uroporphyrinogen-III synthase [Anaerolineales bacterium]|nr:uroporphyrinogen-III synthase [Anaerolineales bacterium]
MTSLSGKKVVVTRPEAQSQRFVEMLANLGANPICLPVIEISPVADPQELDVVLKRLDRYDWLVLTSINGVAAVWERFDALNVQSLPKMLKTACIGPKTAASLNEKGYQADFVPEEYIAEAILPGLGDLEGLNVLLARADIARPDLPEAIRAGGGIADDICAYRTIPAKPNRKSIEAVAVGVDLLIFTSPSTVENFFQIIISEGLDPLNLPGDPIVGCIGPITAKAAEKKGYQAKIIPGEYTIEGLLKAIKDYFKETVNG